MRGLSQCQALTWTNCTEERGGLLLSVIKLHRLRVYKKKKTTQTFNVLNKCDILQCGQYVFIQIPNHC